MSRVGSKNGKDVYGRQGRREIWGRGISSVRRTEEKSRLESLPELESVCRRKPLSALADRLRDED